MNGQPESQPGLHYLIAEDDPLDVQVISAMLKADRSRPIRVSVVERYAEVIDILAEEHVDALLLDLHLKDGDGAGFIPAIARNNPQLPIIVITVTEDEETAIQCLQHGVEDYVSKHSVNAELIKRSLRYSIERKRIEQELKQALDSQAAQNEKLNVLARTDHLTGLPNRVYFQEVTERAIANAARTGKSVGLLYFDLNGFKRINDTLGHACGDEVLVEVGRRLTALLRNSDTIARMGGDEFVVLTGLLDDPVQSYSIARKIHKAVTMPIQAGEHLVEISASIGIATYPEVASAEELVKCADIAMYDAKLNDQHFATFYTRNLAERLQNKKMIQSQLRQALIDDEIEMVFQPVYSLRTQDYSGYESLARWESGITGEIPTTRFIPVADTINAGTALTDLALRSLKEVYVANPATDRTMSINLFGNQLVTEACCDSFLKSISDAGLPAELIGIEISEEQLTPVTELCKPHLRCLASHGVAVAIDRFGVGGMTMSQILSLPIHTLKLHRALSHNVHENQTSQKLVRSIVSFAETNGLRVVACGVEHEAEFACLQNLGCQEFQGHLFSRPVSASEIPGLQARS
ncbi:MAG: EAL domain-containing protein [Pseudomonadales bacterium]|nr:EAL domain-containing protein [Pseudomonadales bacterium]